MVKKVKIAPSLLIMPEIEERLDVDKDTSGIVITWRDKYEQIWDIKKISDEHLLHLFNWMMLNNLYKAGFIISCEMTRRTMGYYPEQFEMVCKEYKRKPDISRLQIKM